MTKQNEIPDGGPAFPCKTFTQDGYQKGESMGMSLRDWFAGMALSGMLSSYRPTGTAIIDSACTEVAVDSYRMADAMLKARGE